MLDIGTIVTAAIVVASPFIFMGYVRFLVRRAEAHGGAYKPLITIGTYPKNASPCSTLTPYASVRLVYKPDFTLFSYP